MVTIQNNHSGGDGDGDGSGDTSLDLENGHGTMDQTVDTKLSITELSLMHTSYSVPI